MATKTPCRVFWKGFYHSLRVCATVPEPSPAGAPPALEVGWQDRPAPGRGRTGRLLTAPHGSTRLPTAALGSPLLPPAPQPPPGPARRHRPREGAAARLRPPGRRHILQVPRGRHRGGAAAGERGGSGPSRLVPGSGDSSRERVRGRRAPEGRRGRGPGGAGCGCRAGRARGRRFPGRGWERGVGSGGGSGARGTDGGAAPDRGPGGVCGVGAAVGGTRPGQSRLLALRPAQGPSSACTRVVASGCFCSSLLCAVVVSAVHVSVLWLFLLFISLCRLCTYRLRRRRGFVKWRSA